MGEDIDIYNLYIHLLTGRQV